jgi:hypothetical protein
VIVESGHSLEAAGHIHSATLDEGAIDQECRSRSATLIQQVNCQRNISQWSNRDESQSSISGFDFICEQLTSRSR